MRGIKRLAMTTKMARVALLVLLGLIPALITGSVRAQEKPKSAARAGTVALIGGKAISDTELEEIGRDKLARIKAEELNLKRQILEEYIVKRLLEDQARHGVTVEALEKSEIEDKILPVTGRARSVG